MIKCGTEINTYNAAQQLTIQSYREKIKSLQLFERKM